MGTKERIESLVPSTWVIRKAVKKAEEQSQTCERQVKDILDEIGDCFHDDAIFRRRMVNKIFFRPKTKKKIAYRFMNIITQEMKATGSLCIFERDGCKGGSACE